MIHRLALLALFAACADAQAQDPVRVEPACGSVADGAWESAPFFPEEGCEWFEFRHDTSYRIAHTLGRAARSYEVYLAFSADGRASAPAAGDMAVLVDLDAEDIVLRNRTGEDFFVRLVLR